jgi:hypothetical protein
LTGLPPADIWIPLDKIQSEIDIAVSGIPLDKIQSEIDSVINKSEKEYWSIVICGHVDSGKSKSTGRLVFELGSIPERELDKILVEAKRLDMASFALTFYVNHCLNEHERRVSMTIKGFYTGKWCYTILDAPDYRAPDKDLFVVCSGGKTFRTVSSG